MLLEHLSDSGNVTYAYVTDLDEVLKLFVEDLTSTLQVFALDATLPLADGTGEIPVEFNSDLLAYYHLIETAKPDRVYQTSSNGFDGSGNWDVCRQPLSTGKRSSRRTKSA